VNVQEAWVCALENVLAIKQTDARRRVLGHASYRPQYHGINVLVLGCEMLQQALLAE